MKFLHGLDAVFLNGVCDGDHAGVVSVRQEHQRRLSLTGKDLSLVKIHLRYVGPAGDEADASANEFDSVQYRHDSVAREDAEPRHVLSFDALFRSVVNYCPGEWMLALLLKRICQLEQTVLICSFCGNDIGDSGLTAGDSACLVQRYYLYLSCLLQYFGSLEEYSVLRADAVAYHYGYRRCETQGAGTAYDQD